MKQYSLKKPICLISHYRYALYVEDNYYLEDLWNSNQKVSIPKGRLFFHLNPRLCYEKITQLEPQLKESNISITDVPRNSNGELVLCKYRIYPAEIGTDMENISLFVSGESILSQLNVTVDAVNANEARITIDYLTPEALTPLIGYIFHYREAPRRNISVYDSRHGCGQDRYMQLL